MKAILLAVAVAAASLWSAPALAWQGATQADPAIAEAQSLYEAMAEAVQAREWEAVREHGDALMAHPIWPRLNAPFQARVQFQLGIAYSLDDAGRSVELFDAAEANYQPVFAVHFFRAFALIDLERWADAAADQMRLARERPEAFADIELRTLWRVVNGLEDAGETETRLALLETITEFYVPADPFDSTDYVRMELARAYAGQGQARRAMLQVRQVGTASAVAPVHYENAFSDLWALGDFETTADLTTLMAEEIEALEALVAEHPDNLNGAVQLIQAYSGAGRYDDAHRYALALYDRLQNEPEAFLGTADMENWFLNEWAYIRYAQGDWQHGEALMREAAGLAEGGGVNVSQVINLASSQIRRGGFDEALETLADFDPATASEVGNMFVWGVRACAHYGLGNREEGDANRALMEAASDANLPALQEVLACADDEEASAALFLARLADSAERSAALEAVQIRQSLYPEDIYAQHHVWRERLRAMHQRPEVQAAIAEHGRVIELPIYQTYFGDS